MSNWTLIRWLRLAELSRKALLLMNKPAYTVIPDTSDSEYWEVKTHNGLERSSTFVPRDRALHKQLQENARKERQVKRSYKDRHKTDD